jgi:hypothetical protein
LILLISSALQSEASEIDISDGLNSALAFSRAASARPGSIGSIAKGMASLGAAAPSILSRSCRQQASPF